MRRAPAPARPPTQGTHNQLLRAGLDPGAISRIFITHMHGDHCFGLPGLLAAVCQARLGRESQGQPVHVYGPPEVHALLLAACRTAQLRLTTPVVAVCWALDAARAAPPRRVDPAGLLQFAVQGPDQGLLPRAAVAELEASYDAGEGLAVVREGLSWSVRLPGGVKVAAAQLSHRVPCWGYVFVEPTRVLDAPPPGAQAAAGGGGGQQGQGAGWVRRGRKLVILGDTCDSRAIASLARGCDLLSHEATFMRGEKDGLGLPPPPGEAHPQQQGHRSQQPVAASPPRSPPPPPPPPPQAWRTRRRWPRTQRQSRQAPLPAAWPRARSCSLTSAPAMTSREPGRRCPGAAIPGAGRSSSSSSSSSSAAAAATGRGPLTPGPVSSRRPGRCSSC